MNRTDFRPGTRARPFSSACIALSVAKVLCRSCDVTCLDFSMIIGRRSGGLRPPSLLSRAARSATWSRIRWSSNSAILIASACAMRGYSASSPRRIDGPGFSLAVFTAVTRAWRSAVSRLPTIVDPMSTPPTSPSWNCVARNVSAAACTCLNDD